MRRTICYVHDAATQRGCADDLFQSGDYGATWTNLTAQSNGRVVGFSNFEWAPKTSMLPTETILATVYHRLV